MDMDINQFLNDVLEYATARSNPAKVHPDDSPDVIRKKVNKAGAEVIKDASDYLVRILNMNLPALIDGTREHSTTGKPVSIQWKRYAGDVVNARQAFEQALDSRGKVGADSVQLQQLKEAVEAASSFMTIGTELKQRGIKYQFTTGDFPMPPAMYSVTMGGIRYAIVNKKYVEAQEADVIVGDVAIGKI